MLLLLSATTLLVTTADSVLPSAIKLLRIFNRVWERMWCALDSHLLFYILTLFIVLNMTSDLNLVFSSLLSTLGQPCVFKLSLLFVGFVPDFAKCCEVLFPCNGNNSVIISFSHILQTFDVEFTLYCLLFSVSDGSLGENALLISDRKFW